MSFLESTPGDHSSHDNRADDCGQDGDNCVDGLRHYLIKCPPHCHHHHHDHPEHQGHLGKAAREQDEVILKSNLLEKSQETCAARLVNPVPHKYEFIGDFFHQNG